MFSDIVRELRHAVEADTDPWDHTLYVRAADEIERLRAQLAELLPWARGEADDIARNAGDGRDPVIVETAVGLLARIDAGEFGDDAAERLPADAAALFARQVAEGKRMPDGRRVWTSAEMALIEELAARAEPYSLLDAPIPPEARAWAAKIVKEWVERKNANPQPNDAGEFGEDPS